MTSAHFEVQRDPPGLNPFVQKGWGHEYWIVNHDLYCGKILAVKSGKKSSWHYHSDKDETFHVIEGILIVRLSDEDDWYEASVIELTSGESLYLPPGTRHQFEGGSRRGRSTRFIEFSTQHFEEDSHRLIKGD